MGVHDITSRTHRVGRRRRARASAAAASPTAAAAACACWRQARLYPAHNKHKCSSPHTHVTTRRSGEFYFCTLLTVTSMQGLRRRRTPSSSSRWNVASFSTTSTTFASEWISNRIKEVTTHKTWKNYPTVHTGHIQVNSQTKITILILHIRHADSCCVFDRRILSSPLTWLGTSTPCKQDLVTPSCCISRMA